MTARRVPTVLLAIVLIVGCQARAVDNEQVPAETRITVRFSHVVAENTPKGIAARRFADLVNERSAGRIEVQVFPNSSLYADGEEFQALLDDKIQLIAPSTSLVADLVPEWQILDLPFLFADTGQVSPSMAGPLGRRLTALLEPTGMVGLEFWEGGFRQMTNSRRELRLPADFRGLRMRYQASPVRRQQFELLGAQPVRGTFADLYRLLEQGEADGQENSLSNIESKRLFEVQRYLTVSSHSYLGYVVLADQDWWNGLAERDRAVLAGALAETTDWLRANAPRIEADALDAIRESGDVLTHELAPDERATWRTTIDPIYLDLDGWLPGDLAEIVRAISTAQP
ncbi:MAG: DctP family TRAP transporter solute-binding subunit [Candidatus Limnocylindrales bacterium]